MEPEAGQPQDEKRPTRPWRPLVAYWLLGLCNNFGYVVMLTAAGDIIKDHEGARSTSRDCSHLSTGAILLADIIPCLVVKLIAPFLPFFVRIRVVLCILLSIAGFLCVAFSESIAMSLLGVAITSVCSGLGEVTLLQYCSFYHKNVVSAWSSGTGGAGVFGAVSYTILANLGFQTTLLIMIVVPITMGLSFFVLLPKPEETEDNPNNNQVLNDINREELEKPMVSLKKKFAQIPYLLRVFMIPLGSVYLFEYFINQGTFELIQFDNVFLSHDEQYRWLQVDYQIGVFLSRSSVNFFHIRYIWILTILQGVNVVIFTTEAIFWYFPSFWIIIALTLWEGLLGGAAYVNTFYRIQSETPDDKRQFSMSITSFGDTIGITLAGIVSIYAHNAICDLPKPV